MPLSTSNTEQLHQSRGPRIQSPGTPPICSFSATVPTGSSYVPSTLPHLHATAHPLPPNHNVLPVHHPHLDPQHPVCAEMPPTAADPSPPRAVCCASHQLHILISFFGATDRPSSSHQPHRSRSRLIPYLTRRHPFFDQD